MTMMTMMTIPVSLAVSNQFSNHFFVDDNDDNNCDDDDDMMIMKMVAMMRIPL